MNRARTLAAEREYLRLDRAEGTRQIEQAIDRLDAKLMAPRPPEPTAYGSVVQVGEREKFRDPYDGRRVSWILHLVGGERVIVIAPRSLDTTAFATQVEVLLDTGMAEAFPDPVDD